MGALLSRVWSEIAHLMGWQVLLRTPQAASQTVPSSDSGPGVDVMVTDPSMEENSSMTESSTAGTSLRRRVRKSPDREHKEFNVEPPSPMKSNWEESAEHPKPQLDVVPPTKKSKTDEKKKLKEPLVGNMQFECVPNVHFGRDECPESLSPDFDSTPAILSIGMNGHADNMPMERPQLPMSRKADTQNAKSNADVLEEKMQQDSAHQVSDTWAKGDFSESSKPCTDDVKPEGHDVANQAAHNKDPNVSRNNEITPQEGAHIVEYSSENVNSIPSKTNLKETSPGSSKIVCVQSKLTVSSESVEDTEILDRSLKHKVSDSAILEEKTPEADGARVEDPTEMDTELPGPDSVKSRAKGDAPEHEENSQQNTSMESGLESVHVGNLATNDPQNNLAQHYDGTVTNVEPKKANEIDMADSTFENSTLDDITEEVSPDQAEKIIRDESLVGSSTMDAVDEKFIEDNVVPSNEDCPAENELVVPQVVVSVVDQETLLDDSQEKEQSRKQVEESCAVKHTDREDCASTLKLVDYASSEAEHECTDAEPNKDDVDSDMELEEVELQSSKQIILTMKNDASPGLTSDGMASDMDLTGELQEPCNVESATDTASQKQEVALDKESLNGHELAKDSKIECGDNSENISPAKPDTKKTEEVSESSRVDFGEVMQSEVKALKNIQPTISRRSPETFSPTKQVNVQWSGKAHDVFITGSWLNWNERIRLEKSEEEVWSADVELDQNLKEIELKFIVDGAWLTSPDIPSVDDGFGNRNNVIRLMH